MTGGESVGETHPPEIELSVVIPAYNEADRIVTTLQKTLDYLENRPFQGEVIVVSDGSTDDTVSVVQALGRGRGIDLRAIEYHPNRGKGYAVRTGMLEGKGAVLMFMDADYSVPIQEMEKGLACLRNGYDVAMGSRALSGSRVVAHQNFARELSAKIYTMIQSFYLGIPYRDTQCGFKLFTRRAARVLFDRQKLSSVIFDPEILWLAKMLGFQTVEFPVCWRHIGDSRIQYDSVKKSLFVFQELFRIKQLHPPGSLNRSSER
ncbi:MAG: glycosyltransferase family 2 protein [Deltaproteobacteria bacterium]|nr:glycosyltransferase family 2 protein [Deltaproteobacteria bacterium]MBW1954815.1 glycosyltransferase family 2 protein [Deltaproteobacteria bacterium]MBW2042393.1 glycosyltransferase family 2 protein [Deltaproteobacteria bacterium]MBW2133291.1 glycosyltransferase family 2 protein [Deltaproteobacteria bacterium]